MGVRLAELASSGEHKGRYCERGTEEDSAPPKPLGNRIHRLCAMAEFVFHPGSHLGKRLLISLRHEERIVAKSFRTLGLTRQAAFHRPGEVRENLAALRSHDHTTKAPGPSIGWHPCQFKDQLSIVGVIVCFGTGISSGTNPGLTTQGIDLQTGVVRKHQRIRALAESPRLQGRIFKKGGPSLFYLWRFRQRGKIANVKRAS